MDEAQVIERVKKLLARADTARGVTEAEAETARKLAQDLMMKYNLDMASVEAMGDQGSVVRVKEDVQEATAYKWQRQLARHVAEAHFCYYFFRSKNVWVKGLAEALKKEPKSERVSFSSRVKELRLEGYGKDDIWEMLRDEFKKGDDQAWQVGWYINYHKIDDRWTVVKSHTFIGRKANVLTAQLMYSYLIETIRSLVPPTPPESSPRKFVDSWQEGCADRICERLAERRKDLIAKHDAQVMEAEAARRKAAEEQAKAAELQKKRELPANRGAEARSSVAQMGSSAVDLSGRTPEPQEAERPEADLTDGWTPGGKEAPEPVIGTSLVLASVYDQSEHDANEELAHGWKPGQIAEWRRQRDEREKEYAEERAKAELERVDEPVEEETERQREARRKREAAEHMKRRRRWARESDAEDRRAQREWNKKDHSAYHAGAEAGKNVGLDSQVSGKRDHKRLS